MSFRRPWIGAGLHLHEAGCVCADASLADTFDALGKRSSVEIAERYL